MARMVHTMMMRRMMVAGALLLVLGPGVARAQNREHLQMTADLRMLQEQVARAELAINRIVEQLAATDRRVTDMGDAGVKGFANQQVLINQLGATLSTMREKLDDNSGRVSQLSQEFSAIREGVRMLTEQINVLVSLMQPSVNPTNADAGTGGGKAPLGPVAMPESPGRYYSAAWNDYMGGRYDIAIEGFREVVQKFPNTPDAGRAQFYIGEAYYQQRNKCQQAIPEYQKVIDSYRDSELVPDAYLMQGVCYQDLNQTANARKMFELVRDRYPNSTQATQATQKLRGMGVVR